MLDNFENGCLDSETACAGHPPLKKTELRSAVIESTTLFAGMKEILISHAGEVYRLRITRNGKLILNK